MVTNAVRVQAFSKVLQRRQPPLAAAATLEYLSDKLLVNLTWRKFLGGSKFR